MLELENRILSQIEKLAIKAEKINDAELTKLLTEHVSTLCAYFQPLAAIAQKLVGSDKWIVWKNVKKGN